MNALTRFERPATSARQVGVPTAAARVLAACATARELCPDLPLHDDIARLAFEKLGGRLEQFEAVELRCTAFRTFVVDRLARDYFARVPGGLGVGIWSSLGTRAHRLPDVPWVDVDSHEVAELRRLVLPRRRGWLQLGTCLCHASWLEPICGRVRRQLLMVLDESVLPIAADALLRLLDDISRSVCAGSELIIAFDADVPLRAGHPLRRNSLLEVVVRDQNGAERVARYPRLRFFDQDRYPDDLSHSLAGVNAVATLYRGVGAPAIAHLRVE